MKKLLALVLLTVGLSVQAQVAHPYFWTNGVAIQTNVTLTVTIPLGTNQWNGIQYQLSLLNAGLTGTNKYTGVDLTAYGCWRIADEWGNQYIQSQLQQKDAVAILAALPNATPTQITNICNVLGITP